MNSHTDRYKTAEYLLNKPTQFKATFQKYGISHGTDDKLTLLVNLKHNDTVIIDHIWVDSTELLQAKLRTNQPITLTATVKTRKRPPTSLYDPPLLDIKLTKIILKDK